MDYPWYQILPQQSDIQQGDLVWECPIVIPPSVLKEGDEPEIEIRLIDSIVLSQSCDLVNSKTEIVLVCPFQPLTNYLDQLPEDRLKGKGRKNAIDDLRKGHNPAYHLLNKEPEIVSLSDYQVVDFRNVYGIQFTLLRELLSKTPQRMRLLPPYREHLSQAFARYFMRVGLPQDIRVEY